MRCNQQHLYSITSQKLKGQLMMDSCNFIAGLHSTRAALSARLHIAGLMQA